ncbi:halocyanin domain-containing protein [Halopelagius longus]|uniref:Halocyanin domain-containing protein n=1 Tax=Halopelagius longus TaxID=1236180 RepID=A0A1H1FJ86_9EURY|nr:halocyanin domain-containing protein [Halopelagius longus]RDI70076.1 halocyanin domain-containing protein [Halopelagius longus]SDR00985.1 halocyanin domain-containing protein [Halopelagius longus]
MSDSNASVTRRTVLRGVAGSAVAGAALGAAGPVSAQSSGLDSWFSNTSNYDGVVDETGNSEVTVTVGAEANGGGYGFGPAAIRVDPGTTVVWEWSGAGGSHNVVAEDGSFESEMTDEKGHTFEQTFDGEGVVKYACAPHKAMGMKGAVVVGDAAAGSASGASPTESSGASEELKSWFEGVSNYDGVVDRTGTSEVTVTVGASGNNGNFAFAPPAVRVSPGATVVWEWSGNGGSHNVAAEDGSFESEMTDEKGHTFSQTFEEGGTHKYVCTPHQAMGMKGAVVVDDSAAAVSGSGGGDGVTEEDFWPLSVAGSVTLAVVSPIIFGVAAWIAGTGDEPNVEWREDAEGDDGRVRS